MPSRILAALRRPKRIATSLPELRYLVFEGMKGETGDSAYEEAVQLGFEGTEEEWLASLKGAKGQDGSPGAPGAPGAAGRDGVSPTVSVTQITDGHRVTITDAAHPQGQSFAVMNGSGIPEDVKVALLDCFENVAWINDDGQTYYDALYAALYPPKTLVSISAVFTQGSAVIYDTDSLDTLKQYLTVTAYYDDSSSGVVTNYTLSGTLTVGTSTITVSYGGKTTTFNVVVSETPLLPIEYQEVEWIGSTGTQLLLAEISFSGNPEDYEIESEIAVPEANASTAILMCANSEGGFYIANVQNGSAVGLGPSIYFSNLDITQKHKYVLSWDASYGIATCEGQTIRRARSTTQPEKVSFFNDYQKLYASKCRIYSAKVKQSGVYVRDLVPCYRKSDNVIGMYDVVGNAFYINTGTGTFTKGENV